MAASLQSEPLPGEAFGLTRQAYVRQPCLLIIHHEVHSYHALSAMLSRCDAEVIGVPATHVDGVSRAHRDPDVLILQLPEPVTEHRALLEKIRLRWPRSTTLVIGRAGSELNLDAAAKELGVRCVIQPPVSQRQLLLLVGELIG